MQEIIVSYLLENNFTETKSSAIKIIESMSDEWIYSIVEAYEGGKPLPKEDQEALNKIRQRLQSMGKIEKTPTTYVPTTRPKRRKLEYEVK
jgi:hypothetical protein